MLRSLVSLLACSLGVAAVRDYEANSYYALKIHRNTSPEAVASHLGLKNEGPLQALDDHYVFSAPKHDHDIVHDSLRKRKRSASPEPHVLDSVLFSQKQEAKQRLVKRGVIPVRTPRQQQEDESAINARAELAKQLSIVDPEFNGQWHLYNTKDVGNDLNVTGVWLDGITGKGVTVCIIDDGLDMDSLDLKPNYFAKGSYDFNDGVDEPKPRLVDDQHGTRCAGEVAASKNDVCGVGVAYESQISGIRILSKPISDIDEAESIGFMSQYNDIYSCSWGPQDDGKTMEAPGILIQQAMLKAIQEGRDGKGNIYVYAAGNGAYADDNCNYDGYTNSIYSISVGAIDRLNKHPFYSEKCSAQLVVTYSSGSRDAIHTTDVGLDKCTASHGGTSAAGPLAAGVYALALSIRPDLTWRDVQWLTVLTADSFREATNENDWQDTPLGVQFSHQFGYGKLNAGRLIDMAKTWKNVKPQAWYFSPWIHVNHDIPEGDQGLHSTFTVTKEMLQAVNFERVEHVVLTMNAEHQRRGDLYAELVSPTGIRSILAPSRRLDDAARGYVDWNFMSVAHFGEDGVGEWTVIVKDTVVNNDKLGKLTDWRLKLFGESVDAGKAKLLPMPDEHDDDDHEVVSTAPVSTAPVAPHTTKPLPTGTDRPTRPSLPKPTDDANDADETESPSSSITAAPTSPTTTSEATSMPTSTALPEEEQEKQHEHLLPSIFPTFGVSKSTQIWIYGSLAIIGLFIASLLAYFYIQRRKRLAANPREGYEFEMLHDDDELDAAAGAGTGRRGSRQKKGRRAGELYDAFAGESDEDSLFSDGDDDDDAHAYGERDRLTEK